MTQYTTGQVIKYRCAACQQQTTGVVEGVVDTGDCMPYDMVLATCDGCGSTRTVAHLPKAEAATAKDR